MTGNRVLVYGHSDADGHIAAVQSWSNLDQEGSTVLDVIVDFTLTRNWRFFEHHLQSANFADADTILIVDLMFNKDDPKRSYDALRRRAVSEPNRHFIVIDHHPNLAPLEKPPDNVELRFTSGVYHCCYGPPSDMMAIAALCDADEKSVPHQIADYHRIRARGVKRAVTDTTGLAGKPTLQLLRNEQWSVFEQLADEPNSCHRTMYGNRVKNNGTSPLLEVARTLRALYSDDTAQ